MTTDAATLETRLTEAEDALHRLLVGTTVTVVGYDGHRTEFAPSDETRLRRYIASLKRQLGRGSGRSGSRPVMF
ncbi:putative Head-to-tail joining protein W (gpW) [Roseivivax marinus]|uniref:Putative Head-to-tail joining protein W (GpW) n=1 Tax=Roseivivax marinus TaxID=1379903 RepID=W4HCW7_9RHOB|nr:gpW family head-tail joining protein [Roseivivax marinus]ETW10642.1 putative Head-to-tail joining protein W (gpW) [Roseivivax marinus]